MSSAKKKVIFAINVDNHIDLITNSSSELFILQGKTKETVEEMITGLYANYRDEYDEVKNITELTVEQLDQFLVYMCHPGMWPAKKSMYPVPPGFTFEELYEEEETAWNKEMQYKLRNNVKNPKHEYDRSFVTEENREDIINRLSPNKDMWFLYSLDENPNYEMQEQLETVGARYHLG